MPLAVRIEQVVGVRHVLVHRLLHESHAERAGVEVDVLLRIAGDAGDVVNPRDGAGGAHNRFLALGRLLVLDSSSTYSSLHVQPRSAMSRISRRDFVTRSSSCAAHLALAAAVAPDALRRAWAHAPLGPVVATEPFGSLEQVADRIWALISTPLGGDRTTLSNGGIIAGRSGVIAIEGFNQPAGAAWLAAKARELTGRWPTHVVVTHYHADHANGVAGYLSAEMTSGKPALRATERTRDLVLQKN